MHRRLGRRTDPTVRRSWHPLENEARGRDGRGEANASPGNKSLHNYGTTAQTSSGPWWVAGSSPRVHHLLL
jgi:hypothetical protein